MAPERVGSRRGFRHRRERQVDQEGQGLEADQIVSSYVITGATD